MQLCRDGVCSDVNNSSNMSRHETRSDLHIYFEATPFNRWSPWWMKQYHLNKHAVSNTWHYTTAFWSWLKKPSKNNYKMSHHCLDNCVVWIEVSEGLYYSCSRASLLTIIHNNPQNYIIIKVGPNVVCCLFLPTKHQWCPAGVQKLLARIFVHDKKRGAVQWQEGDWEYVIA